MNHVADLDRAIAGYFEAETVSGAPAGLLEVVLDGTHKRRPRPAWRVRAAGLLGLPRVGEGLGRVATPILIGLLVLALVAAAAAVGSALLRSRPVSAPFPASVWTSTQPTTMSFGDPSGAATLRLDLDVVTNVASSAHGTVDWLKSTAEWDGQILRLTTRSWVASRRGANDGVAIDLGTGDPDAPTTLPPCAEGAVGRYFRGWNDERTMTLEAMSDDCPARAAVLAAPIWSRVTTIAGGQPIRVDAFTPAFSVTMPGTIEQTRTNVSWVGASTVGVVEVRAWLDPQGMREACNAQGGYVDTAPGVAGFEAFLRARSDFEVVSSVARTVDGLPAATIVLRVKPTDPCALGLAVAWQGRKETTGIVATIAHRSTVRLVVVEVGAATLLFQVKAGDLDTGFEDPGAEDAIIDSLRIEDRTT